MKVFEIRVEPSDFSGLSPFRWGLRRFLIGYLLFSYCIYSAIFFVALTQPGATDFLYLSNLNEQQHLWISAVFGLLGSVFTISRAFMLASNRRDFNTSWYILRPLHGIMIAVFIYYAFRAGQLIFYSGSGTVTKEDVNIWTISILAILAGVFTEDAYTRLASIATGIFRPIERGGG